ncbi:VOC family protein [Actinomycetospora straminea]|uniref:VOC domain-containing protein n=1 Tax=Actinomycetospora straminea TaxID=663607 RepID=A0ABP9F026_9PSEU|nr:VOC family protein [Actinomycetospora straminea]MDD7935828.1 VOC family protein [Actinomycetospora straminea]
MTRAAALPPVLARDDLPPGYGSVNPFVAVRGPGGAEGFLRFVTDVLDARETLAAHAVDADGLLIHAEVRVGSSTIMLCDAKPHWAPTPGLLWVYVRDVDAVTARARAAGAEVVTEPTAFHGGQRLARVLDPWSTLWWLVEYGADSVAPSQAPDALPAWRPDPTAPPSDVHRTVDRAMTGLGRPAGARTTSPS